MFLDEDWWQECKNTNSIQKKSQLKNKKILLNIVTSLKPSKINPHTYMHTCTKHTEWEQQRDSRSVSMAATELLVFLLHWVGCLPACLSLCPSVCQDWHDSQSRKSRQDTEVSHAPWCNTPKPRGQHDLDSYPVTSYSSSTLMVSYITLSKAFLVQLCS